ncbi:hypothetical protein E3N88_23062 [Mikania micrantha]|uniref:Uncharacterized protein n=1 Tax=Mikania micrantha TaxID=192012 RepID=A0A5N6NC87_9ASTR|nr:hypothetical protein E3N88_23062 [Mikania micrantha]
MAGNKLLVASSDGVLMMMSSKLLFQAPMASQASKLSCIPPGNEHWLQAYRADDLRPVPCFPSSVFRLGSLVELRLTAWNSR